MHFTTIPTLVYHQVIAGRTSSNLPLSAVTAKAFQQQIHYLYTRGYRTVSLENVLDENPADLPEKPVIITFDDGYHDFLTNAFPILTDYGFCATVLIITDRVEAPGHADRHFLSWDEIRLIREGGMQIGSHTCTHPHLLDCSSDTIRHELVASKAQLEAQLDVPIDFLAYPYGESAPAIQSMAREAGYVAAWGVITGRSNLYNIWRRPCIKLDTMVTFRYKLSPLYSMTLRSRHWLREETRLGFYLRQMKNRVRSIQRNRPDTG